MFLEHIFARKCRCLARLAGVQRALQARPSIRLEHLERQLRDELNTTLAQEETYWRQKSRVTWLKEGERNTRFFPTSKLIRRRRNTISQLKLADGSWCDDVMTLKVEARQFYFQLYSVEPCLPFDTSNWTFPPISHRDRHWLNYPVTSLEIHATIFQMGADKAPGPDGCPPCLFQRYWHILGPRVTEAIQGMFQAGELLLGLNEAIICLLPKGEAPESLNQFRPISLCNVLLKVISKSLPTD